MLSLAKIKTESLAFMNRGSDERNQGFDDGETIGASKEKGAAEIASLGLSIFPPFETETKGEPKPARWFISHKSCFWKCPLLNSSRLGAQYY
jgi:hypothetical protein